MYLKLGDITICCCFSNADRRLPRQYRHCALWGTLGSPRSFFEAGEGKPRGPLMLLPEASASPMASFGVGEPFRDPEPGQRRMGLASPHWLKEGFSPKTV